MYEIDLDPARQRDAEQAAADFIAYVRDLLARRRQHNRPGQDLLSDLVVVTDTDGTRLNEDELVATVVLLFMAGHEASVNLVGNGVLALMRHRDQWQRLINEPGLAATAVEELIRYEPDHLDICRTPNPHLGFGAGIHYCLGAPLARIEAQVALLGLRHRLPALEPAGQPQRRPEFVIRGLDHLPVTAGLS